MHMHQRYKALPLLDLKAHAVLPARAGGEESNDQQNDDEHNMDVETELVIGRRGTSI